MQASEPGGLQARGTREQLYDLNLSLRTATRILVRLATFGATSFQELERKAAKIDWGRVLGSGDAASFKVTCRKSRLYHTGAIAERLAHAVMGAVGPPDASDAAGTQSFMVRLVRDQLVLSADATGEHLHRRGYREAGAKAPLRETLAAAVLQGAGWTPAAALHDPLCGSGTLVIEAALRARNIPPGWQRTFACERWPGFDGGARERVRARAAEEILTHAPAPLTGADRDSGAVRAAEANAERAGVADDVRFTRAAISDASPPADWAGAGWIITNPPYGQRIGRVDRLRDLYARLGQVADRRFAGWGLALLTSTPELAGQVDADLAPALTTTTGGLPVRLYVRPPGPPPYS